MKKIFGLIITLVFVFILNLNKIYASEEALMYENTQWVKDNVSKYSNYDTFNNFEEKSDDNVGLLVHNKKQDLSGNVEIVNGSEMKIVIYLDNDDILVKVNNIWLCSIIFNNHIWLECEELNSEYEIISIDLIKCADKKYLGEFDLNYLGKSILRIVLINNSTDDIYYSLTEITHSKYDFFENKSEKIASYDEKFDEYRNSVFLNHKKLIKFDELEEITEDDSDYCLQTLSNTTSYSELSLSDTVDYGDTRAELYLADYDLTLTTWGIDYMIKSVFPDYDTIEGLISDSSYILMSKIDNNTFRYAKKYSWTNYLNQNHKDIIYVEHLVKGGVDGVGITLKFGDYYQYRTDTKELLYTGSSTNVRLEEFLFTFESEEKINYFRVSTANLVELSTLKPINLVIGEAALLLIQKLLGKIKVSQVVSIISLFVDSGGEITEYNEFEVSTKKYAYNKFNEEPLNTTEFSFILDPNLIMLVGTPSEEHTLYYSRWKEFIIDIRYNSIFDDITPKKYKYVLYYKRNVVYGISNSVTSTSEINQFCSVIQSVYPIGC